MDLVVVYDGGLVSDSFNLSQQVSGVQFLYFSAGNDFNFELEIGVSIVLFAPTLEGGNQAKLAVSLGVLSTNEIIPIPREISESGLSFQLAFGVDGNVSGFRAYCFRSDNSLDSLAQQIAEIEEALTQVEANQLDILTNQTTQFALNTAIGANQLAQNQALSLIGTGLIPLTAGVTTPVPLILEGSSLLLLPGF